MNFELSMQPVKTHYSTREQLYALCVLLCWADGLTLDNGTGAKTVTPMGREKGNTGFSSTCWK